MNHDEFDELCALQTLGLLDEPERRRFEEHLNSPCATCRETFWELAEATALLPYALPQRAPSPALKERIRQSIQSGAPMEAEAVRPARPGPGRWVPLTIAVAASLILSLGGATFYLNRQITQQRETIQQLNGRVAALAEQAAELTTLIRTMTDPEVKSIRLAGLTPEPRASGKAFIDARTQTVLFYAYGLTAAPAGKTYQLWAIPKGKTPINAGVFAADSTGSAVLTVRGLSDMDVLETIAVTLEPAGGLPQPSGPMYLAGS
ncbi:MAG: anti-sigma factor [Candidatus Latescibacteria bacterium]|nr:anti-sigma factor [Candidatus Latescibacterota bacterium]